MADRYKENEKSNNKETEALKTPSTHDLKSTLVAPSHLQTDESQKLLAKTISSSARDILVSVTHLNLSSTTITCNNAEKCEKTECESIMLSTEIDEDCNKQTNTTTSTNNNNTNPFSRVVQLIQKYYGVLIIIVLIIVPVLIYNSSTHKAKSTSSNENASHYKYERIILENQRTPPPPPQPPPPSPPKFFQSTTPVITKALKPTRNEITIEMKQKKDMVIEPETGVTLLLSYVKEPSLYQMLTKENIRLKSLCTNAYLTIRKNYVLARLPEDKAFTSDYTLITTIRYGQYMLMKSTSLDLFICYDSMGNLRPTKLDQLSDLCVFKSRRLYGIYDYREYISASVQFANSVLQFRSDGNQANARRSATKACPLYTGLLKVKTQLDNTAAIENLIKKLANASNQLVTSQT